MTNEATGVSAGKITTLVFDLGGVLLDWNPRHLFRKIFADEEKMEWFLKNICNDAWNREQDRGRPFAEAIAERVALHRELEREIRAYDERWAEMLGGEIDGTVALLQKVQALGWPTYALTNFSREKLDLAAEIHPFLKSFRGILVSGDERLVKPDPAIYQAFLSRFGKQAQECFFVDDVEANVEGARKAGIDAVRFSSPEALEAAFRERGIL